MYECSALNSTVTLRNKSLKKKKKEGKINFCCLVSCLNGNSGPVHFQVNESVPQMTFCLSSCSSLDCLQTQK